MALLLPDATGMSVSTATRIAIGLFAFAAACSGDDPFALRPIYDQDTGRIVIEMNRSLESGERLHVQVRRGRFGTLDCAQLAKAIEPLPGSGARVDGPAVDPALTQPFYGPEWAENPTADMLASLANGTDSIVDVCLMNGSDVVMRLERDFFQAWDAGRKTGLGGKADDTSGEVKINSPLEYGTRCVAELGEIPFFEKLGDQSYTTYDCLESTAIPNTITKPDGTVESPDTGTVDQCDNPQYIYSLCEAGPRVASRINDRGTRWVLLCRKSQGGFASNQYNDIAMIGHNPFTGKTCFFQNALYSKTDGGKIPHPGDKDKSQDLWAGVHGGRGSGIQCASCHDADPFIHTPWIDGAVDANGRPIVPKMGFDPDLALGALDAPYSIVNLKGQGWNMPRSLISPEANACLKCHRMGDGRWTDSWLARLEGTDTTWNHLVTEKFRAAHYTYWMPPDVNFTSDAMWDASEYKKALDFIQGCNGGGSDCKWGEIPSQPGGETGGTGKLRNPVLLPDGELADQATRILGFSKHAPTATCAECHAPNEATLRGWQEHTVAAEAACLSATGGEPREDNQTNVTIARDEIKTYGPYVVTTGAHISVEMTGSGDADLYVKRGEPASPDVYDCRPFTNSSNESCTQMQFNAAGPATFYVAVKGFKEATMSLKVAWTEPGTATRPPKQVVDCLRLAPGDPNSIFTPGKAGIYAAASHLAWFQDTFKEAYPEADGNSTDTWAIEYGKFKNRVSMPKGNHPRFSQAEFDIVAEWFARGLPQLAANLPADTGPQSCSPSIGGAVSTHANQMATQGWGATNRSALMAMYGCTSNDPRQCLTALPQATQWQHAGKLRVLQELAFKTYYWMRSSPDGRFIANGSTGAGSVIGDLQTGKDIRVDAAYDPGFFPDNRAWMFQGTPIGAGFCQTSLLVGNPDEITFSEPQCSAVGTVGLYQHLGQGLGGGDYFTINSQFTSDNPLGAVTKDPTAAFSNNAEIKLTPMMFDGTNYVGKTPVTSGAPYEGDSVLSPSTKLVLSRFGNQDGQLGYVLRKVTATPNGGSYDVATTEIARYCTHGAKPSISFDERYFVTHHYVTPADYADLGFSSAEDPAFQALLAKGSSNIILVNMVTGARTRVTTMHAGQYALYPHFRSDGWIYFLVRDHDTGQEYAVASDAAL